MGRLGVEVGLAKSLVSRKGHGEFAKRYFIPADASPISIKECGVALHSASNLVALAIKRRSARIADILTFLGYGFRVKGAVNKQYFKLGNRIRN